MWTRLFVLSQFCHVLVMGNVMYRLIVDDPEILLECPDAPEGTLDVHGLFNMDELNIALDDTGENVYVTGNVTSVWDIQPDDRVEVKPVFKN